MNIAIIVLINLFFTLSSFAADSGLSMYGDKVALAQFETIKEAFIQAGAQKVQSLPIKNRETAAALYEELNSEAAPIRAGLAQTSGTKDAEDFGVKRLGNGHITNTPVHAEESGRDVWRLTVNNYFKQYLENMAAGKNNLSYKLGAERTLKYTWLTETGKDLGCYTETSHQEELLWIKIFRLIGLEYSYSFGVSFEDYKFPAHDVMMRTLKTFPKTYEKPEKADINFIFMQIFDSGLHMGTYIFAVDAGTSSDLANRAQKALRQFSGGQGAPYTGLLFIHSNQNTLPKLMRQAKEAFIDFVVNTDIDTTIIKVYKEKLLTFRWYKSNEMYFLRGSLAVAEWLEAILARSASIKNINRSSNWQDGTVVDGLALIWPLDVFLEQGRRRMSFSWAD